MREHTSEQWAAITGYEGIYEVSDHGRVRSLARTISDRRGRQLRIQTRILRAADDNGYRKVGLCLNGRLSSYAVHRLVMLAFVGPRPANLQVHHRNGVRHDNRLSNLVYVTALKNTREVVRMGNFNHRAGHNRLEFPPSLLPLLGTEPDHTLGRRFGVSKHTIRRWRRARGIPSCADATGRDGRFRPSRPHA